MEIHIRRLIVVAGCASLLTVVAYCGFMTYREGFQWEFWAYLWDNYLQLITATLIFSVALAFYCYISSFFTGEILANDTGNFIYDVYPPSPSFSVLHANQNTVVSRPPSQPTYR